MNDHNRESDVRLRGSYMHYAETKYGFEWVEEIRREDANNGG